MREQHNNIPSPEVAVINFGSFLCFFLFILILSSSLVVVVVIVVA
jgi:hypothetical protein